MKRIFPQCGRFQRSTPRVRPVELGMRLAPNHPGGNGRPGGNVPAGVPPGGGSSDTKGWDGLYQRLAERSQSSPHPLMRQALTGTVHTHATMKNGEFGAPALLGLNHSTTSWRAVVDRALPALEERDYQLVASGLYAIGDIALSLEVHSSAQISRLAATAGDYLHAVCHTRRPVTDRGRWAVDMALGHMLHNILGWMQPNTLAPMQQHEISALGLRMALASGSFHWPSRDLDLPNIAGALHALYPQVETTDLREASLLEPTRYIASNAAWRPSPWGAVEWVIASLLEGSIADARNTAMNLYAGETHADVMVSLTALLHGAEARGDSVEETLHKIIAWVSHTVTVPSTDEVSLPEFLAIALKAVH